METPAQPQPIQLRPADLKLEISCPECGSVIETVEIEQGDKTDARKVKCDAFCDIEILVPTVWVRA